MTTRNDQLSAKYSSKFRHKMPIITVLLLFLVTLVVVNPASGSTADGAPASNPESRVLLSGPQAEAANVGPATGGSPYYDFDIIAAPADYDSIEKTVSINNKGRVAFIGASGGKENLYVGDGSGSPLLINGSNLNVYDFNPGVQINDNDQVVTSYRQIVGGTISQRIYSWDGTQENTDFDPERHVARGRNNYLHFDAVFGNPSMNNEDEVVFSAIDGNWSGSFCYDKCLVTAKPGGIFSEKTFNEWPVVTPVRPIMADDANRFVARYGKEYTDPIFRFDYDFSGQDFVASEGGRSPGISPDGKLVVYATNTGIYANFVDVGFNEKIAGYELDGSCSQPELGYNENGDPICLAMKQDELDSRVGVSYIPLGPPGLEGDSFVVTFIADPTAPSRINPHTGLPLLHTYYTGLWSVRVDIEKELDGDNLILHRYSPIPVVQGGDIIGDDVIDNIAVYDPISNVATWPSSPGIVRTQRRGDHQIAFWAETTTGKHLVVRASNLDSDLDGLFDHWEWDGVDIDRDGTVDLDLAGMGATPGIRDLFLELDWTAPKKDSSDEVLWHNGPAPYALTNLQNMFWDSEYEIAPALEGAAYGYKSDGTEPDPIPWGIDLHLDAGPGHSFNMGGVGLQGGDEIGQAGDPSDQKTHIDAIYFGKTDEFIAPGVELRSFHDIKENYFGTADKRARELVFHYGVLADLMLETEGGQPVLFEGEVQDAGPSSLVSPLFLQFEDGQLVGHVVKITSGPASGELKIIEANSSASGEIEVESSWDDEPQSGNEFVLLSGHTLGIAEADWQPEPDNDPIPANDFLITMRGKGVHDQGYLANPEEQWRTIAHELGHNLGLRHGGFNHENRKPSYVSIMNYLYTSSSSVYYSTSEPFNDWQNLDLSFPMAATHLNNSFDLGWYNGYGSSALSVLMAADIGFGDAFTIADYIEIYGRPPDLQSPVVTIISPVSGEAVALDGTLPVIAEVTDNIAVGLVEIQFDVDGDGVAEVAEATPLVGDNYGVDFNSISGPAGNRVVSVTGQDSSGSRITVDMTVTIVSDTSPPDEQPPDVTILAPSAGEEVTLGATLTVTAEVTDNVAVDLVEIQFDVDGDGTAEVMEATPLGGDNYGADFNTVSGPTDERTVRITGRDTSGNPTSVDTIISIVSDAPQPDEQPPDVTILTPAAGDEVTVSDALAVTAEVTDNVAVDQVEIEFDVDGDGVAEVMEATSLGGDNYGADFNNVSGPTSDRTVSVTGQDTSGNQTSVERTVSIVSDEPPSDVEPPDVTILTPATGDEVVVGDTLTVTAEVTDNVAVDLVEIQFDVDGDGVAEVIGATPLGGDNYGADFNNVSGPTGERTVSITGQDTSGNQTSVDTAVSIVSDGSPPESQNINDLLDQGSFTTVYDATPGDNAPAGIYTISATFSNISGSDIGDILFEVAELSGGNLLLNADDGPAGAGAILSLDPAALGDDSHLQPAESFSVDFEIGLQQRRGFRFLVDAFGIPGSGPLTPSSADSNQGNAFEFEVTGDQLTVPAWYLPIMIK